MSLANLALLLTAAWCILFAVLEKSVASDDEAVSRQRARYTGGRIFVGVGVAVVCGVKVVETGVVVWVEQLGSA